MGISTTTILQQADTGAETSYTEVEAGLTPASDSTATQTARTSAFAALVAEQGLLDATQVLPSGLHAVNAQIVVPRQGTMVGQGRYKTVFSLFGYSAGRFIVSDDFDDMLAANYKFNEHLVGGVNTLTYVTNGIELRDFGVIGRADNTVSDRPLNSSSGDKGSTFAITAIKLWGGGHRLERLALHQIPGTAIWLQKGGLTRAGNTQFLDDQFTLLQDVYIQCSLSGIEWVKDADGRMHNINVHSCLDYGVNCAGHGALNAARIHTWGNCIGQNWGTGQVDMTNLSDLYGDNDMCGVRLGTALSNVTLVRLLNCKQVGMDVCQYANISNVTCKVPEADFTPAAYDPDYRPWPTIPYMALYTSAPDYADGTGGTEVSGGSYARQAAAYWGVPENASGVKNNVNVDFGTATADWGTVVGYGLWDHSSQSNVWMGGGAVSLEVDGASTNVVTNGDAVIVPKEGCAVPTLDPRPLKEFYTESTEISTSTWKPGAAIGVRIRQSAIGSQIDGVRITGPGKTTRSIGIELRGSRTRLRGRVSECYNGLIVNYYDLVDCDVELYIENCTEGIRFEAYREQAAGEVGWTGINNRFKIFYRSVTTPVVNNTNNGTEWNAGLGSFNYGRRDNFLEMHRLDPVTVTTGSPTLDIHGATYLNSSGGAITATLPDGDFIGRVVNIQMSNATTSSTVEVTNHTTSSPEIGTFDALNEYWTLRWNGTAWETLNATCTFV